MKRRLMLPILAFVLLVALSAWRLPLAESQAAAPTDRSSTLATSGPDVVIPATLPSAVRALRPTAQPALFVVAAVAAWSMVAASHALEWRRAPEPLVPPPGRLRALLQVYLN